MRQHGEVTSQARLHGINPSTVHQRLYKGWDFHAALTTPVRSKTPSNAKYRRKRERPAVKSELVWNYLLKNRTATPIEVINATGVSKSLVYSLMNSIGTPREVFEAEAQAANMSTQPPVQEDASYIEHAGVEKAIKLAGFAATTPPEPQRDGVWTSTIVVAIAAFAAFIIWG